ncbi:hypothetical protein [Rodentibacter caecimuris]|uniref:Uncharacterized protein n=1 Tax=Rodentibacter caecimuris TaxID=1796644 RepID=A0A9X8YXN9_9PAST|nr:MULTISPECIES: hypothetical protein [Pasteurellaceae]OOF73476.1 hypothetical protein BKG90_00015 [Rodentibacter heylii]QIA76739.1 hypothetical protein FEE42_04895 [Rodentibacter heylii]TGY48977.1 hypothetical protein E5343_08400 [Pasteurella caecimuris]
MTRKNSKKNSSTQPRYGYGVGDNLTHIAVTALTNAPAVAFSFFIIYSTIYLSDEKRESILSTIFEKDSAPIWPYVVIVIMAIIWFIHVKLIRQLHSSNMRAAGLEKSKLQSKLAGKNLGSSDD